ncbi:leucine-rich repeat protein [Vallitalea okinawensis]|uniref:leucine-rich repeat protein n=1 Tax=Vallitalea okinawensis TaxID=2078660 RepID=UPI000CFB682D|nr:leucine-rich repeat protein [Vallitalea okinawensis]
MKINRVLGSLILLVLIIVTFHQRTLANSADSTFRNVTIDSFTSGDLGTAIAATTIFGVETVETLTITNGIVNATDFEWIKNNLTDLEILEIRGNAKVDSGTNSFMDDNTVPSQALFNMNTLKEVTITTATTISSSAFNSCNNLEKISLPSATTIDNYAFSECTALTDIELPVATSIGKGAFFNSYSLESINLPKVEGIGEDAFKSSIIATLYLGSEAPIVGTDAFSGCPNSRTVYVPQNSRSSFKAIEDGNSGDELWYGWNIYEISDDASLQNLEISTGDLVPNFISTTTTYDVIVSNLTENITITPTVNHNNATVTVEGNSVASEDSVTLDLYVGTNEINIIVTASDTIHTSETIINVTRSEKQAITIDSFTSGDLGSAVSNVHGFPDDVISLTITGGVVNANDFEWIETNLSYLETLEIIGDAKVDSGTDSFMDDNMVPDDALSGMETLREVTISSAVTIGESAFYDCGNLESVELSSAITIGDEAFYECYVLSQINIPLVEIIGEEAFYSCDGLEEVELPAVEWIKSAAFDSCSNLQSIDMPMATTIDSYAFSHAGLINVDLPNVIVLGSGAFNRNRSLVSISAPNITDINESTFNDCSSLTNVDMPNVITISGGLPSNGAFSDCENLQSIVIPMVETIESYAFFNCGRLESLTIGENPPSIDSNAFTGCADTRTIKIPLGCREDYENDSGYDSGTGLWYGWIVYEISDDATLAGLSTGWITLNQTFSNDEINYTATVSYSEEVIRITPTTNHGKASVTVEGNAVDSGDSVYIDLAIGNTIIDIIVTAEDGSTTKEFTITVTRSEGESVIIDSFDSGRLEEALPDDYSNITSLLITGGVVMADDFEFIQENLEYLEILEISGEAKVHSDYIEDYDEDNDTPDNKVKYLYEMSNLKQVKIPIATAIGAGAFQGCTNLEYVELLAVTSIESEGFYECTSLSSINIPLLESVGDSAFYGCSGLEEVNLPAVATIGDSAFYECTGLEEVNLPAVITIGDSAFYDSGLQYIYLPMATTIGHGAFEKTNLVSVDLPEVITIGESAFKFCTSLISISAPKVTVIESNTFNECTNLMNVDLPMVVTINDRAFYKNNSLINIELPKVTSIGDDAFADCTSLNSITLGETVPTVESDAFDNISTNSPTVYVPMGSGAEYKADTSDSDGTDDEWYGFAIYEISNDATLSNLALNSGSLSPVFDSTKTDYSVEVNYAISAIKITPTANNPNATVAVEGNEVISGEAVELPLSVGVNELIIVVTAEDGSTTIETKIIITRTGSYDATLASIELSAGTLSPVFSSDKMEYTVDVTYETSSIEITPTTSDLNATVTVEGNEVTNEEVTEVPLSVGTTVINIVVTSEDRSSTLETILIVTRAGSSDAGLSDLVINPGTLNPVFDSNTTSYFANVDNSISSINISPKASHSTGAIITVEGIELASGNTTEVPLSVGANEINIVVTAEDGMTTTQTILMVTRAANSDAILNDLAISPGTLNPVFDSAITNYSVSVTYNTNSIEITPTVNHSTGAMVTVEGNQVTNGEAVQVPLSVGINEINIVVTAEDGISKAETIITVTRAESNNNGNNNSNNSSKSGSNDNNSDDKSTEDLIIEQLESQEDDGFVEVAVAGSQVISENVFDTLQEKGTKLIINGDWYQWEFDGQTADGNEVNTDFTPVIEMIEPDSIGIDLSEDDGFIIQTTYEGKLPMKAKLKFNVYDFVENQSVYLYYYNETSEKLELIETSVNQEGQAEFNITHCSIYTISNKPMLMDDYKNLAYINGYSDGTFRPDQSLTRAEAAAMLSQFVVSDSQRETIQLSDADMWAEEGITKLTNLKIINGYSDGTFRPNHEITRAELAVILSKTLGLTLVIEEASFTDTKDHWAEQYILALRDAGIVNGYNDGSFKPNEVVTRAEAVTMINNAFKKTTDTTHVINNPFSDLSDNHWAYDSIINAVGQ